MEKFSWRQKEGHDGIQSCRAQTEFDVPKMTGSQWPGFELGSVRLQNPQELFPLWQVLTSGFRPRCVLGGEEVMPEASGNESGNN